MPNEWEALAAEQAEKDRILPREIALGVDKAQRMKSVLENEMAVLRGDLTRQALGRPPSASLPPPMVGGIDIPGYEAVLRAQDLIKTQEAVSGEDVDRLGPPEREAPSSGLLSRVTDILTRPLAAIAGPIRARVMGAPQEVVRGEIGRGFRGEQKTTFTDVLAAAGVPEFPVDLGLRVSPDYAQLRKMGFSHAVAEQLHEEGKAPLKLRSGLGLALDIVADPLTYVTFGAARAIKIGTIAGAIPVKVNAKGLERLASITRDLTRTMPLATLENKLAIQSAGELKLLDEIASGATHLVERGGMHFMGKTVLGTPQVARVAGTGVRNAWERLASVPIGPRGTAIVAAVGKPATELTTLGDVTTTLKGLFVRDAYIEKFPLYFDDKQKYLNALSGARLHIAEEAHALFKGTKRADRVAIYRAVEGADPATGIPLPPSPIVASGFQHPGIGPSPRAREAIALLPLKLSPIAEDLVLRQQALAASEAAAGLGHLWREDYMFHMYTNYPALRGQLQTGGGGLRIATPFTKERTFPTLADAKAIGLVPVTEDAAEAYAIRKYVSARARAAQNLVYQTGFKYGVAEQTTSEMIKQNLVPLPRAATVFGEEKAVAIPRAIAQDLERMQSSAMVSDVSSNMLIRAYDRVNNLFKGSVTALFPAFHFGNYYSNVNLQFLDIGYQAANPIRQAEAWGVLAGRAGTVHTAGGLVYTLDEVRQMLKDYGLKGAFKGRMEIIEAIPELKAPKILTPLELGRTVGSALEDSARTHSFLAHLRRGVSPDEAAARTKQFLFDYDNLSPFERSVARRALPFYTFWRKNTELQVKTLFTEPGRQATLAKLFTIPGEGADDKEFAQYLPMYLRDGFAVDLGTDALGRKLYLSALRLPLEDLNKLFAPSLASEGAVGKVTRTLQKTFMGQLHPFLKLLPELLTEKDFFRGQDLKEPQRVYEIIEALPKPIKNFLEVREEFDRAGERRLVANPLKMKLFTTFFISRVYTASGQVVEPNTPAVFRFIQALSGTRVTPVDMEDMALKAIQRRGQERKELVTREAVQAKRGILFGPQSNPWEQLKE